MFAYAKPAKSGRTDAMVRADMARPRQASYGLSLNRAASQTHGAVDRIQTKLGVSEPEDALEQAADRTADEVMRAPSDAQASPERATLLECASSGESFSQTRTELGQSTASPSWVRRLDHARQAGGEALSLSTRHFMEPRFHANFVGVKVHHDETANELSRAIQARAFTVGQDVFFRQGEFRPWTHAGQRLLAHELAHVEQQRSLAQPPSSSAEVPDGRSIAGSFPQTVVQRQVGSALRRGWQMYSGMNDEGADFARRLMRWRILGLGADYRTNGQDDWSTFMSARPEIQRAAAALFERLAVPFAAGGTTGSEWSGGWRSFNSTMTGVRLNELESMRLTLHGCERIDVRGRYWVGNENGLTTVKFSADFTWIDRADLHPGTTTELQSGQMVDDREFSAAGFDYNIAIRFEIPGSLASSPISTWVVEGSTARHVRGWPPITGAPAAGWRG